MEPGSALDRLIAEKVMGWKVLSHWDADGTIKHLIDENQCEVRPPEIKPYSTNIADAFEVTRKFQEFQMLKVFFPEPPVTRYVASFRRGCECEAPTMAHAICLAALRAI